MLRRYIGSTIPKLNGRYKAAIILSLFHKSASLRRKCNLIAGIEWDGPEVSDSNGIQKVFKDCLQNIFDVESIMQ